MINLGLAITIFLILFAGFGFTLCLVLKHKASIDLDIQLQNEQQQKALEVAKHDIQIVQEQYSNLLDEYNQKYFELSNLTANFQNTVNSQADTIIANAQDRIKLKCEDLNNQYTKAKEDYSQEYTLMLKDLTEDYNQVATKIESSLLSKRQQLNNLNNELDDAKNVVAAAVEANKRTLEMESKVDFYKLNLSNDDVREITELRSCFNKLRNPEPLNKVIWKVYYEKPTTDLIGRVIGTGTHCGIYKITNTLNNMCYVGQSVNIAERWKQHIKRGIGADTPTRNKLYPAMMSIGVENFSFEIIEECDASQLNDKEKFWTDYFKAQEFGYSVRKG